MTIAPPRVLVHDAAFKRLGRLSRVSNVARSYTIDNRGVATMQVGLDEPLLQDLRPQLGRVLVIESSSYTLPWIGKLTTMRADMKSRSVTMTAKTYASIFDHRILGPAFTAEGSADAIIHAALREANALSDTGVVWGGGSASDANLQFNAPNQKVRTLFDNAASFGNLEWYLDAEATPGDILLRLTTPRFRGEDRYTSVRVQDGKQGDVTAWKEDGEDAAFAVTVVGARDSATQAINDRPISRVVEEISAIAAPHGYLVDGSEFASNLLTRNEVAIVSEELKAAGSANSAALSILAHRGGTVRRTLTLDVTDPDLWPFLHPGDVIRVSSDDALVDGYDGPVRLLAVQPDEEDGQVKVATQILRRRADTL